MEPPSKRQLSAPHRVSTGNSLRLKFICGTGNCAVKGGVSSSFLIPKKYSATAHWKMATLVNDVQGCRRYILCHLGFLVSVFRGTVRGCSQKIQCDHTLEKIQKGNQSQQANPSNQEHCSKKNFDPSAHVSKRVSSDFLAQRNSPYFQHQWCQTRELSNLPKDPKRYPELPEHLVLEFHPDSSPGDDTFSLHASPVLYQSSECLSDTQTCQR